MSNPMQSVKLGQSLFQDTFFVANSQLTPYRKLRQLELELNELDTSIKKANFNLRRQDIKKREYERILRKPQAEVSENKELIQIDLEELELGIEQTKRLLEDAEHRRDNFLEIRNQLLSSVPQEYWDQGFENAELENWTKHFAKQLSISMVTGVPNVSLIEQMASLPVEMTKQIMLEAKAGSQQFLLLDKQTTTENTQ
jgi:hypothetical protein